MCIINKLIECEFYMVDLRMEGQRLWAKDQKKYIWKQIHRGLESTHLIIRRWTYWSVYLLGCICKIIRPNIFFISGKWNQILIFFFYLIRWTDVVKYLEPHCVYAIDACFSSLTRPYIFLKQSYERGFSWKSFDRCFFAVKNFYLITNVLCEQ